MNREVSKIVGEPVFNVRKLKVARPVKLSGSLKEMGVIKQ